MGISLDNISFTQFSSLLDVLRESKTLDNDFIKSKYLERAKGYEATVEFFSDLSMISFNSNEVVLSSKLKSIITEPSYPELFKKLLFESIIRVASPYREEALGFYSLFELEGNIWVCKPSMEQRLKYSRIRNLLIDIGYVENDPSTGQYFLLSAFPLLLPLDWIIHSPTSREKFERLLDNREALGRKAELQIIEFEKERLVKYPDLIERIEYIADKNVGAGYDIKSFETKSNDKDIGIERYIEVKAVQLPDCKFYWSRNEINVYRDIRDQYFLYLVPIVSSGKFDIKKLRIIRDPYQNIFNNHDNWSPEIESYSFQLKSGHDITE